MWPTGTVTFLLTDIEGSSRLWELDPDGMRAALSDHDARLRAAVEAHNGRIFKSLGDGICAVFDRPSDALAAALAAQLSFRRSDTPAIAESPRLRVRIAIHTGTAEEESGDYLGPSVNRTARMREAASGGQTLISEATAQLVRDALPAGVSLQDLGEHRLRDLQQPERIHQLFHPALPADFGPLNTLSAARHNLPIELNSFIGREREMEEVIRQLSATRLLTLTGTGGCGKTRLALHVAAHVVEQYPDGVWFADLAPLTDPSLVSQAVAHAFDMREEPGREIDETLKEFLSSRTLLLILDNCEHLVDRCAALAETLLKACAGLRILATSREPLSVGGEVAWRVPSLDLPPEADTGTRSADTEGDGPIHYAAVRLFVERAAAVNTEYRVAPEDVATLVRVCRQLDGIPLAIELAAARTRVLTVGQIASRLDNRFELLTGGSRTALPRQQTIRAAIEWSYSLLSEAEREMLARLSVFAGGWSIEAAEVVCADGLDVLETLGRLVDKSLALMEEADGQARYRMLTTIRQYAAERLAASGKLAAVRERHARHFAGFAAEAEPKVLGPAQEEWLNRVAREHDNLRVALDWCVDEAGDANLGLQMVASLSMFWHIRGHAREGLRRGGAILARAADLPHSILKGRACNGAGNLARDQGNYEAAEAFYKQALEAFRAVGHQRGEASSLSNLGLLSWDRGDCAAARSFLEESLAIHRGARDERGESSALNNLGNVASDQGELDAARTLLQEALAIRRRLGDPSEIAIVLHNLGEVASRAGDDGEARSLYEEALALFRRLGDMVGITHSLLKLGELSCRAGRDGAARARGEEGLRLSQELGDRRLEMSFRVLLGTVALHEGSLDRAAAEYEAALGTAQSLRLRRDLAPLAEGMAGLAAARGDADRAAWLLGMADSLRDSPGAALDPVAARFRQQLESELCQLLSPQDFERARNAGRAAPVGDLTAVDFHLP